MRTLPVLISSAGRRVGLMQCFRESISTLGFQPEIWAIDASSTSPAFHIADHARVVPRCTAPGFVEEVLDLCDRNSIRLVVPTIDTELETYSGARDLFASRGTTIAISGAVTTRIAVDKNDTYRFLSSHGFPVPRQWTLEEFLNGATIRHYPALAKPARGSASKGVRALRDNHEAENLKGTGEDYIVQELLEGEEYTINVFVDHAGKCRCAVPHQRIETRGGEVSKGVTAKDRAMMHLAAAVVEALPDAFGAMNLQCFRAPDGATTLFEINARFGGGYPLAHRAGAVFTQWLLEDSMRLPLTCAFDTWQDDLGMLRFDDAVYLSGSALRNGRPVEVSCV